MHQTLTLSRAGLALEWEKETFRLDNIKIEYEKINTSYLFINGGNVGGGATVALGISFPIMPMFCNCSGRSDDDDCRLNPPRPAIILKIKFHFKLKFGHFIRKEMDMCVSSPALKCLCFHFDSAKSIYSEMSKTEIDTVPIGSKRSFIQCICVLI